MLQLAKNIYRSYQRTLYLLKKLLATRTHKLVIYTKNHPIYTSTFEVGSFKRYVFAYIDLVKADSFLERQLMRKSSILHIDATNYHGESFGKPVIVECEGIPADRFLADDKVKRILVESKCSGKFHLGMNDKVLLSYPSIYPRQQNENDDSCVTILSVGYGSFIKGYDVLYRLYTTLKQKYNIRLIIAGTFGHNFVDYSEVSHEAYERAGFDKIEADLSADKNVQIGPIRRRKLLRDIYPQADVFVHFCRMETFGYSVLEALSFGLPVVSCYFRAIPEMVTHGVNGFLVSANGFDSASSAYTVDINDDIWADNCYKEGLQYLEQLIIDKDLRREMGAKSLDVVKNTSFNTAHRVTQLETLYDMYS